MNPDRVNITKKQIADFCEKNHILRLAFFGSVLGNDYRPDSDVDILVYLDRSVPTGLMKMARMERQLSGLIGRKVGLRTPNELSDYFRDDVIAGAEVVYEL
jgi:uncharacterized protein